jgi:hypothetical protein
VLSGLLRRIDSSVKAIPVSTPSALKKLEDTLASA